MLFCFGLKKQTNFNLLRYIKSTPHFAIQEKTQIPPHRPIIRGGQEDPSNSTKRTTDVSPSPPLPAAPPWCHHRRGRCRCCGWRSGACSAHLRRNLADALRRGEADERPPPSSAAPRPNQERVRRSAPPVHYDSPGARRILFFLHSSTLRGDVV